jgi:hypothetical protein
VVEFLGRGCVCGGDIRRDESRNGNWGSEIPASGVESEPLLRHAEEAQGDAHGERVQGDNSVRVHHHPGIARHYAGGIWVAGQLELRRRGGGHLSGGIDENLSRVASPGGG